MPKGGKKSLKLFLGIGLLAGTVALGSTLAASINLNDSGPVEFGQGVTQTTACDDEITLTPISTFVNSQSGGTFMGTSIVVSGVDSSAGGCGGKSFTITGYADSSPVAQIIVSVQSTDPWFTIEAIAGATLTDVSSSSFTITIDPSQVIIYASEVSSLTIESWDSVDVTPTSYEVGDPGPGGGIIFYVATSEFDCGPTLNLRCKYLEVAPSGWNIGEDPLKFWAEPVYDLDVGSITNDVNAYNNALGIGLGYKNSKAIVDQGNANTSAAGFAREYDGGSQDDWYLPTTAELNLLCQWATNVTQDVTTTCTGGTLNTGTGASGGFRDYYYWSSSERPSIPEFVRPDAWLQDFVTGAQGESHKDGTYAVRPIRAF